MHRVFSEEGKRFIGMVIVKQVSSTYDQAKERVQRDVKTSYVVVLWRLISPIVTRKLAQLIASAPNGVGSIIFKLTHIGLLKSENNLSTFKKYMAIQCSKSFNKDRANLIKILLMNLWRFSEVKILLCNIYSINWTNGRPNASLKISKFSISHLVNHDKSRWSHGSFGKQTLEWSEDCIESI